MFTDSHTHLDYKDSKDFPEAIQRARAAGVTRMLNISLGPDPKNWESSLTSFAPYPEIRHALGVHPHEAAQVTEKTIPELEKLLSNPSVAAVGEIGLDFFYNHSPKEAQIEVFEKLLDVALASQLPVSIHSRDAFEDTRAATKSRGIFEKVGGVLHCFTGTQSEARAFLDDGAYISFSGIITFKNAEELRGVVKIVPLERMLIETDSPFLTPEPYRGKKNESAFVVRVAETVAVLKGVTVDEVAQTTSENADRLFHFSKAI